VEGDVSGLAAGMRVQHQRFGYGEVSSMEGEGENRKANIVFDSFGEKKLILRFAKLRIVEG